MSRKTDKDENKNNIELPEMPLDQDPGHWKELLETEFGDVLRVKETLAENPRISFEAYYQHLKAITKPEANDVLEKLLNIITAPEGATSNTLMNAAVLLIKLTLYPKKQLPDVCTIEDQKGTFSEVVEQIASYLTSEDADLCLKEIQTVMPVSIYKLAEKNPPNNAPADKEFFPWLLPTEKPSQNFAILMPAKANPPLSNGSAASAPKADTDDNGTQNNL